MQPQTMNKNCETCRQPFTATRVYKRYCSSECRNRAPKKASAIPRGGREGPKASPRPCKQCGNEFQPGYRRSEAELCSRKCQGTWINANGLGPRHNDENLLASIVSVINTHERCLSQEELMAEVGTTHKVLLSRKWSMEFLYSSAARTYEAPLFASRFQDRVYSVLREIVPDLEIENDKPLPGMHGFKKGELRADMFIKDLNLIVEADGKQHLTGRGDLANLDYIRANDRLKEEYAAANGITLIRIPETVDSRSIKSQLLRGIRRVRPGFRPLNPSNALNKSGTRRRMPKRREVSGRPRRKTGEKGEPLHDVYCRGCHAHPSYKNGNTYHCVTCWDRWNEVRRSARVLEASDVKAFQEELTAFIKSRGRYVWHPEVYLYLRALSREDLKARGIKVSSICRDLGYFAPPDDRVTREFAQRVRDYVERHVETHGRTPGVREVMKGTRLDHDTLWSCMDYDVYIAELGGKLTTNVRHRFRDAEEFLQAAIRVVKEAGHWLPITSIVKRLGMSHPAYLAHFKDVRTKEIHEKAGVSKKPDRTGQQ
jgi:hypothetical protein